MLIHSSILLSQDLSDSNDLGPLPSDAQGELSTDSNPQAESEVDAALQAEASQTGTALTENTSALEGDQTVGVDANARANESSQSVSFFETPMSLLWLLPLLLIPFLWRLLRAVLQRDSDLGEIAEVRVEFTKSACFSLAGAGVNRESFEKSLDEFDAQTTSDETGESLEKLAETGPTEIGWIADLGERKAGVSDSLVNASDEDAVTEFGSEDEFDFSAEIDELTEQAEESAEKVAELTDPADPDTLLLEEPNLPAKAETALPVGMVAANQTQPFAPTDSERFADVDTSGPITEDEFEFDEDEMFDDDDSEVDIEDFVSDEGTTFGATIENNAELEEEIRANELNEDTTHIAATFSPANRHDEEAVMKLHDDDSDLDLNFEFTDDIEVGDVDVGHEIDGSASQLGAIAKSAGLSSQVAETVIAEPIVGQADMNENAIEASAPTVSIDDSVELDDVFEDSDEDLSFDFEDDDYVGNSVNHDASSILAGRPSDVDFGDDDSLGSDEEFDFDADDEVSADAEAVNAAESEQVLQDAEDHAEDHAEVADDKVLGSPDPFNDEGEIEENPIGEMSDFAQPLTDVDSDAVDSPVDSAMESESVTDSQQGSGAEVGAAVMAAGSMAVTAASGSFLSRLFGWFKKKPTADDVCEEQLEPVVAVEASDPIESVNPLDPSDAATEFARESEHELAIHAETLVVENDEFDLGELDADNELELDSELEVEDEPNLVGDLSLDGELEPGGEFAVENAFEQVAASSTPFELESPTARVDVAAEPDAEELVQTNLVDMVEPLATNVESEFEKPDISDGTLAADFDEAFEVDDSDELSFDDEPAIAVQTNVEVAEVEQEIDLDITPNKTVADAAGADNQEAFANLDVTDELEAVTPFSEVVSESQSGCIAGNAGTLGALASQSNDQFTEELKQANEINVNLEAELISLKSKLDLVTQHQANLNSELDSANIELTSTISELESKNTELNTTMLGLENKIAELAELNLQAEQLKEQAPPAETEPAKAPSKKLSRAGMAASDPELYYRFKKRLKSEHRKRKDTQVLLSQAEKQRDEIAKSLRASNAELKELAANELVTNDAVSKLKNELSETAGKCSDLEALSASFQTKLAESESRAVKAESSLKETESLLADAKSQAAQILASKNKNEPALDQVEEIKSLEPDLTQELESRAELKELLGCAEEMLEESEAKLRFAEESREGERKQLAVLTNQLAAAEQKLLTAEKRTQVLNEAVKLAESDSDAPKFPNSKTDSKTTASGKAEKPIKPEDLTRIAGIGPAIQMKLKNAGVNSLEQIAAWTKQDASEIEGKLSFKDRVAREDWINQAQALVCEMNKAGQSR